MDAVEVLLRTRTPDGVEAISLRACLCEILEEHPAAADLDLIDRTVREPDEAGPIRALAASGSSIAKAASGSLPWWISRAFLPLGKPAQ